jgi:2-oxoisovalerate dehydrogenase E1 component
MIAELMGKEAGPIGGAAARYTSLIRPTSSSGRTESRLLDCRLQSGAYAFQHQDEDRVCVPFFGDGAVAQAFHEAINLTSVWELPVLFFCEDNGYPEFTRSIDV